MRTRGLQPQDPTTAIASYLAFCALVCGLFVYGFYELMQPRQIVNVGLAAYKAPQGTVINNSPGPRFSHEPLAPVTNDPWHDSPGDTTGRAVQSVEAAPPVTPDVSEINVKRTTVTKPAMRRVSSRAREASPTHSQRPGIGYAAAYPGYAAVR